MAIAIPSSTIQDRIDLVEERLQAQATAENAEVREALNLLLASGGKRVRPMVTILAGSLFGAEQDRVVTLAAAIELLHTATLVHDDLIDGSLLRRGHATLNSRWSPAATVLTGDYIFAAAANLAAETGSVEVMRLFAQTLTIIVNGEINQLLDNHKAPNMDVYLKRIHAKTASMFELAMRAAAVLGPVDEKVYDHAQKIGYDIGIAFQIVDDVLDFTGQQTTVGKPVASDLRNGLITLPALYYFEQNPTDPAVLELITHASVPLDDMESLIESIRGSGAVDLAMEDARRYVDRAIQALEVFPQTQERQELEDLAVYFVDRIR
ncbi:MAG: polyprenyl synthetase family protein [Anaerolineales bacterium]|nr:polyprenyl synthetase family protein [Anaerolineales bacterium]